MNISSIFLSGQFQQNFSIGTIVLNFKNQYQLLLKLLKDLAEEENN